MEDQTIIAIVSVAVAFLSLSFAVYKHIVTSKTARLIYEISQLSDYDVPASFLEGIPQALVVVRIENGGNKMAEHVKLRIATKSNLTEYEVEPGEIEVAQETRALSTVIEKLNPEEHIRLLLYLDGTPTENQVEDFQLTHSEGVGINRDSPAFTTVEFSFLGFRWAYNVLDRSTRLVKIGPFIYR